MFLVNSNPSEIKEFMTMAIEGNVAPNFAHFRTEIPNIQSSDLAISDFKEEEGIFFASVFRDRFSPNVSGTYDQRMFKGDTMRSIWCKVWIQFDGNSDPLKLRAVNVGYKASLGHNTIQ